MILQKYDLKHVWDGDRRCYQTPVGRLPGVTTILGNTKPHNAERGLAMWRDKNTDHAQSLTAASARGTAMHESLEAYFQNRKLENPNPYFESLSPELKNFSVPILQESALWYVSQNPIHKNLGMVGYAGSVDYLGYYKGKLVVADWKSSDKEKHKSFITDYLIQVSAYSQAVKQRYDIEVEGCVVVVGIKDKDCQVFEISPTEIQYYQWCFDLRLHKYFKQIQESRFIDRSREMVRKDYSRTTLKTVNGFHIGID